MHERTIAVLKADKEQALDLFTSGIRGRIGRAFYVF
jgi:hypothetical protein